MKKNIITIGISLISALFFTTNCAKEEVSPVNEETRSEAVSFKLNVSAQETRTTTEDGATINWATGDSINVFHAVTGSTEYGSNDKFTLAKGTTFNGELADGALDESKTYDWYVMYPYVSHITTPANTSTGYTTVGSKASGSQKQTGNNNKAHLAGQYFPLYGKAAGVAATETPSITLKQAVAVVKVHVTNNNNEELTVSNVSFTGTENIVGTYYIDFSGDTPVFTASGASFVSNVANLTVSKGTGIAKNGSADFYIAVKPFTANGTLKVAVNGYEKQYSVTNNTFSAGKIKTINFIYDKVSGEYDELTYNWTKIEGTSGYQDWSGIKGSYSNAYYTGNSSVNNDKLIQLRSSSNSGIISTVSGGSIKKVVLNGTANNNKVNVYGKNTPYESTSDLYDENLRGDFLGSVTMGSTTDVEPSNYYEYIGIIANNGAVYFNEIDIYWENSKTKVSAPTDVEASVSGTSINVSWTDVASNVSSYIVTCTGQQPQIVSQGTQKAVFTDLLNDTYEITVQAVPSDVSLSSGQYAYSDPIKKSGIEVTEAATETWKQTTLTSISSTDVFVIVGKSGEKYYAMTNDNGTGSAPTAVEVTLKSDSNGTTISGNVVDNLKWNLSASSGDYTFYPNGSTTTWLYCNTTQKSGSNNNIRVGTGNRKVFVLDSDNNYLSTEDSNVKRYLSIYNNADWRGYIDTNLCPAMLFFVLQN